MTESGLEIWTILKFRKNLMQFLSKHSCTSVDRKDTYKGLIADSIFVYTRKCKFASEPTCMTLDYKKFHFYYLKIELQRVNFVMNKKKTNSNRRNDGPYCENDQIMLYFSKLNIIMLKFVIYFYDNLVKDLSSI